MTTFPNKLSIKYSPLVSYYLSQEKKILLQRRYIKFVTEPINIKLFE